MSRLIAVSNRIPKPGERYTAGGLAVAVRNALEKRGGLWLGWSGEISEAGPLGREQKTVTWNNVDYVTIDLTSRDQDEYYNGFANRALWPLFHHQPGLTEFARRDMAGYYRVNETFARVLAPMLRPDDVIWVHDYHLIPLASELRACGVQNRIGFFLHIPWPAPELLSILPNHMRLAANLASYDLVGFQTKPFMDNFFAYLLEELGIEATDGRVEAFGRKFRVAVFPISIDTEEFIRFAHAPQPSAARRVEESLQGRPLALSVDRLDYSKGIPQRLDAYGRLLELYPDFRGKFTALQIAPTTREQIPEYVEIISRGCGGGRPRQRALRRSRLDAHSLRQPVDLAAHLGRPVPRRAGWRRDALARRHEPRRQGICRLPEGGRSRGARPLSLRGGGKRTSGRPHGQSL